LITDFQKGAMYAQLEPGEKIEKTPVEIGDGILHPGEFVCRLGKSLGEGFYLRYEGRIKRILLFSVNNYEVDDCFYAFEYINKTKLLIRQGRNLYDININRLEKVKVPLLARR
jgi:hypothetical protein